MFRRKKKEEATEQPPSPEVAHVSPEPEVASAEAEAPAAEAAPAVEAAAPAQVPDESAATAPSEPAKSGRGNRVQKVGIVFSDKMQKTVVVRVDRQVMHMKYRRYVRRTTKFKAHDDLGASVGDRVRIV